MFSSCPLQAPILAKERTIIFFDEFPWINTPRSGFLSVFGYFWNSWASTQKNIVIVSSGSDVAWMINKVLRNRGGL